jgi:hypothetical protein
MPRGPLNRRTHADDRRNPFFSGDVVNPQYLVAGRNVSNVLPCSIRHQHWSASSHTLIFAGIAGIAGFRGFAGTAGFRGFAGTAGFRGLRGFDGFRGLDGLSGCDGLRGCDRLKGCDGPNR